MINKIVHKRSARVRWMFVSNIGMLLLVTSVILG